MKTGINGIKLIEHFEGCRLTAYQNTINGIKDKITIGYGHTGLLNGEPIKVGQQITQQQAEDILKADLYIFEKGITQLLKVLVTQNEFDAIVALAFNIGLGAFKDSSVLRFVNEKNMNEASKAFLLWNKVGNKPVDGLTKRRTSEATLFYDNKLVF